MRRKHSVSTTVRLHEVPSNIVARLAESTGKSETFIASWLVDVAWLTIQRQTETGKFRARLVAWERVEQVKREAGKAIKAAQAAVPKE
jgi:hypothetical protein